ncbi:hypothetical protein HK405_012782, partial [Cladochytrium tenue]
MWALYERQHERYLANCARSDRQWVYPSGPAGATDRENDVAGYHHGLTRRCGEEGVSEDA